MNRMMALQLGLLVSFLNMHGMDTTYSCKGTMEEGKPHSGVDVKILCLNIKDAKGVRHITYQPRTKNAHVGFNSDVLFKPTLEMTRDGAAALAKAAAISKHVALSTIMPGKKNPKNWRFFGHSRDLLNQFGKSLFEDQLSETLMSKNKNVIVHIESGEGALQADHIKAELQTPYSFNPFGSFSIKIAENKQANNKELNLSIDKAGVERLLYHAMLTEKTNPTHNNIKINYTEQGGLEKTAFLDRDVITKQLPPYLSTRLLIQRGLGLSVVGFLALLAYLKFTQK